MCYHQKKSEENQIKKYDKMAIEDEINEIGEELDLGKIGTDLVNNVIPKFEEFGEPLE